MSKSASTSQSEFGFTLVEMLVVLGLFLVIFSLSNVSLSGLIANNTSSEFTQTLVSELRRQQNRAMTGERDTLTTFQDFGVYFEPEKYTLFSGSSYIAGSPGNFVVELPSDMEFVTINLPNNQVIFEKSSGEVASYSAGLSSVRLRNTTNQQETTITFNKLGVPEVSL